MTRVFRCHTKHSCRSRRFDRLPAAARLSAAMVVAILTAPTAMAQSGTTDIADSGTVAMPSLWDLAVQGGWFMIPIGVASIVTVVFTLERLVGLRRRGILPKDLIAALRKMIAESNVSPQQMWDVANQRRSPLANVVKAAVLKTGRSQAEVEKSVEDAVEREVSAMTRNLRPINVVASISPLIGLLGTVQGMIMAFMVTSTTSSTGTAKAQELAHGIYTALVTTFAGLFVAVVSVVLANFLEGKIEKLLRQMEAVFLDLLPHLEPFEGRVRVAEAGATDGAAIEIRNLHAAAQTREAQQKEVADSSIPTRTAIPARRTANRNSAPRKPRSQKRPVTESDKSPPASTDGTVAARPPSGSLRANFDS